MSNGDVTVNVLLLFAGIMATLAAYRVVTALVDRHIRNR